MAARGPGGPAKLLSLALLGFLAFGSVDAFGPLVAGRKWLKLNVPGGCRGSSGWLGPDVCGSPRGNGLLLKTVAGGPWTTWRLTAAPGIEVDPGQDLTVGVPVVLRIEGRTTPVPKCGSKLGRPACPSFLGTFPVCKNLQFSMKPTASDRLSQFVIEHVDGAADLFYIRSNARSGTCPMRYLGAAIQTTRRGCKEAKLGLFTKDETNSTTRWQIIDLPDLRPCPSPPPPPRRSPPPPRPWPPPLSSAPPPPSPSPPPPSPSPPPPSPSPPPPSPSPPPPSPSPPPPSPSPPPPSPSPPPPSPSPPPPSPSPPPPSPSPPPPSPSPPPPSPSPPPPSPSPPPPSPSPPPPDPAPECFPAHASVSLADGRTIRIKDLRTGDRMLSVDWRGRPTYAEVFYWSHWEPALLGVFTTVTLRGAGDADSLRQLQLSRTHFLPVSKDASGACAALAAASAGGGNASTLAALAMAWTAASDGLGWEGHTMLMPPQLSPGMVAWVHAEGADSVAPACILSAEQSVETGAYAPVVRARGIVVDGVVASMQTDWYVLHGRWLFPDPAIPALAHYALTPLWWAYKLAGPQLAWRLNRLPAIANRAYVVANTLVWGPVLLVALVLWAVWRSSGRASVGSRRASRPALFRAHTRPFSVPMGAARR